MLQPFVLAGGRQLCIAVDGATRMRSLMCPWSSSASVWDVDTGLSMATAASDGMATVAVAKGPEVAILSTVAW